MASSASKRELVNKGNSIKTFDSVKKRLSWHLESKLVYLGCYSVADIQFDCNGLLFKLLDFKLILTIQRQVEIRLGYWMEITLLFFREEFNPIQILFEILAQSK